MVNPITDTAQIDITNNIHFIIDGYIVNTDTTPLKKQYEEMHKIGVNINQIAKKVNSTGDLYSEEMQELKEMEKEFWRILRSSPLK